MILKDPMECLTEKEAEQRTNFLARELSRMNPQSEFKNAERSSRMLAWVMVYALAVVAVIFIVWGWR